MLPCSHASCRVKIDGIVAPFFVVTSVLLEGGSPCVSPPRCFNNSSEYVLITFLWVIFLSYVAAHCTVNLWCVSCRRFLLKDTHSFTFAIIFRPNSEFIRNLFCTAPCFINSLHSICPQLPFVSHFNLLLILLNWNFFTTLSVSNSWFFIFYFWRGNLYETYFLSSTSSVILL